MQPKVNQHLYIQIESLDEEESRQEYKARIADLDDSFIMIEIPIHLKTGKLKRVHVGDALSAYFVSDEGMKSYFNSEVIGHKEEAVRLVVIRRPDPESITRVQRRGYLRVPAWQEVAVKVSDHVQFVTLTEDIGGGGISFFFNSSVPLRQNDTVSCWLLLNFKNGVIDHAYFKGDIVRVKMVENGRSFATLSFSQISNLDQQKIIRYCFERQLEIRK